jgi:small redox-active disulfide protein 2
MKIEILGMGCQRCKMLEANAKKAVDELKIKAVIVKITDIDKIVGYGVMSTPAIVVDGQVKSYGKVADVEEIKKFLK